MFLLKIFNKVCFKNVCLYNSMPPKIYASNVEDVGTPIPITNEKKPRTEKQLAALEKAKLRRKAKAAEQEKLLQPAAVAEEAPKPEPSINPKAKKSRKRKQDIKETESNISEGGETLVEEKETKPKTKKAKVEKVENEKFKREQFYLLPREEQEALIQKNEDIKKEAKQSKKRIPKNNDDTPAWFKSYIMGVKEEQARMSVKKIPKKQVKFEADQEASEKWGEPVTRERVNRTVDNHMQSMYAMVFPNRKF